MLRFYTVRGGLIRKIEPEEGDMPGTFGKADWIDAYRPDKEERILLEKLVHPDLPESSEIEEIEASARFFVDPAGIHIHSLFLTHSEGRYHTVSVAFILQPDRLISIRNDEPADFRLLRMRARRGRVESRSSAELLITLQDQKVENLADGLEDIHMELEKTSHAVLEEENSDLEQAIDQLAKLEDSSGKIRLCLMDSQRAIAFLQRQLKSDDELQEMCREVMRDIDTLMSHTTFLFDRINFLMDSTQGFISIQQNQIIKIFSIAAVVFLPPTLVASIYGMNFEFMPEMEWLLGYPFALVLMVASAAAPYLFFKHKGWL